MKLLTQIFRSLVLILVFFAVGAQASDFGKEKRWADQIVDEIMTGDAVWLMADGRKFLGIYTESTTGKVRGAVIILHGVGVHPNWTDVVLPLRTQLPESGWHTLSLQMPILPNSAGLEEYAPLFVEITPRINAGIALLSKKGINKIIIIGHSMGATMAGYYIANSKNANIHALVTIGAAGHMFKDSPHDIIHSLKKITIPVLDISGSEDLADVVATKKLKAKTAKMAGNNRYQQVEIAGANHFLVGKETELIKEVSNWLNKRTD